MKIFIKDNWFYDTKNDDIISKSGTIYKFKLYSTGIVGWNDPSIIPGAVKAWIYNNVELITYFQEKEKIKYKEGKVIMKLPG